MSKQAVACWKSSYSLFGTQSGKQAASRYQVATNCLEMMFDHGMGAPLGLHRKPSRVESAKRLWRVSPIPSDGKELLRLCAFTVFA